MCHVSNILVDICLIITNLDTHTVNTEPEIYLSGAFHSSITLYEFPQNRTGKYANYNMIPLLTYS